MADHHTPPLESGQLLRPDLPLITSPPPPPMVNGDGPQQVILVQVNPGEAFTIQREDGHIQCITGPAQVPMMSPNGSVPPIYVPPGYVSQIIEENGVRRVLVLPQPEFHPGGHSPLHHAPPPPPPPHAHMPAFLSHPSLMGPPHPHPHLYSGIPGGAGDLNPQYISQYHPAHIYSEQDPHSPHSRPQFVPRDERASKTYERLQKKLKERQGGERGGGGGGGGGCLNKDSPPSSPLKSRRTPPVADLHNGLGGKGLEVDGSPTASPSSPSRTPLSLGTATPTQDPPLEPGELDEEALALQARLNTIGKPEVVETHARSISVRWSAPPRPSDDGVDEQETAETVKKEQEKEEEEEVEKKTENEEEEEEKEEEEEENTAAHDPVFTYEVSVSCSGKDGRYVTAYSGEDLTATLEDLRPATDYHVRVQAMCECLQGSPSDAVSFTTLSCEPEAPSPPKKANGTKNSLSLQWKPPCDNGSKIQNYILQWDKGLGTCVFEQCYYGPQKQYRVTKLTPATRYAFRLAAKNHMGISEYSEVVELMTSCGVPAPPAGPELLKAGVTWLSLQWQRPSGSPSEDDIAYVLEMEEHGSGYGFQPSYNGEELTCTVKNLHRSTTYKFRLAAYNSEGKSNPSNVTEVTTLPDRPGSPARPSLRGKATPTSFRITWDAPKDGGGAAITKYTVEISAGLTGASWEEVYTGSAMECVCDGLKPGCGYQTRVYCVSQGGQSMMSEPLQVQTPAVPPGPCAPPRMVGRPKAREMQLRWSPPQVDGGSAVCGYSLEVCGGGGGACAGEEGREVYQGHELDCTVTSLLPGCIYSFRVRAANKAGYGPFSERYEATTGPGAPEQCQVPHVTCKSPSCAVASWEAPPCNGAPVTEFRLEWGAAEGSMQVCYSGSALTHDIKGLLPATNYFCRVQAVNVAGSGAFSEVVLCQTPCSVPAAVSVVHALRESEMVVPQPPRPSPQQQRHHRHAEEDEEEEEEEEDEEEEESPVVLYSPSTCLGLRWEAPCNHGNEITSYLIDLGEKQPVVTGPVTTYILQHLQPDTTYRLRIQALNSLGAGPFSHTFKLKTKPLPPPPPRLECSAFSHQTLRLKWGDGSSKTTSDASQYHLQMADRTGRFSSLYKGPCHTHKVHRLNESTSYSFRIQAFNEAGNGPFSNVYTFTTLRSPPATLKAPKVERVGDQCCDITWESLQPMKGDPISYTLQSMLGNSEFKQVYKGSSSSYNMAGLQVSSEYRFRVCAHRLCQDGPELAGPFSPTVLLPPQRPPPEVGTGGATTASGGGSRAADARRPKRSLTDEQLTLIFILLFGISGILIAFVIQYFVIK